jgi:nitrate reductase gamma subunit
MHHNNNGHSRHKLRLVTWFAVLVSIFAVIGVQVAVRRPPSNVALVVIAMAGLVLNIAAWIVLSRRARKQGERWRTWLTLMFIAASIACIAGIAFAWGDSRFAQYAVYIAIACIFISSLVRLLGPSKPDARSDPS